MHSAKMKDLKVIVVGAGIGGLQTALALATDGHQVTVVESAKAFEEVGAGIRIPPNSLKLSNSWGVDFTKVPSIPARGLRFLDWKGKLLLTVPYDDMQSRYGAPYLFLHRADLIQLLVSTAKENANITIKMGSRVTTYNFDTPSATLSTGETLTADVIIASDGIKSAIRDAINGSPLPPQDTGDVAYRILVPTQPLLQDPETASLVREPWAMHWMGPEGHAVGYPLRGGDLYNIIIDVTHASDLGEPLPADGAQVWKETRSNRELIERFRHWCPQVRKLCAMAGDYLKWRLADFDQLEHWVSDSGKVALLGDACHPMMPYMAQGAAQATEDAGCMAACLRRYGSVREALGVYEQLRKPRATYVARNTRVLQEWLHIYDGEGKAERDKAMEGDGEENPIYWGWKARRDYLFGYDASDLGEQGAIPSLPPMPKEQDRVYSDARAQLRGENKL